MKVLSHSPVFSPVHADKSQKKSLADYCEKLRRADSNALGFVPFSAFEDAMHRNRMLIEMENAEPCGFMIFSIKNRKMKILMIAIQQDARRIFHATNLITAIFQRYDPSIIQSVSLRCADDLESNHFWQTVGFKLIKQVDGGLLKAKHVRPKRDSQEAQIVKALGKKLLMKLERTKNVHRRINVYRLDLRFWHLQAGQGKAPSLSSLTSKRG